MEGFEEWELAEELDGESLDWLFGEGTGWSAEAAFAPEPRSEAAARALAEFMPALIEGLHRDPAARALLEELSGTSLETVAPDDAEAWPAIIGALATALPSIISAIPSVVNAVKSVTGGGQRQSAPRPAVPATTPVPQPPPQVASPPARHPACRCPGETHESYPDGDEALDIEALWRDVDALAPDESGDWPGDEAPTADEDLRAADGEDEERFLDD